MSAKPQPPGLWSEESLALFDDALCAAGVGRGNSPSHHALVPLTLSSGLCLMSRKLIECDRIVREWIVVF